MPRTAVELFAQPRIEAEYRADGSVLVRSSEPLGPYAPSMAHLFRAGAAAHPERVLAAVRTADGTGWDTLTWGEARTHADAIAQALLEHGLGPERPLLILSGNSLEHLLMLLGAHTAGVPVGHPSAHPPGRSMLASATSESATTTPSTFSWSAKPVSSSWPAPSVSAGGSGTPRSSLSSSSVSLTANPPRWASPHSLPTLTRNWATRSSTRVVVPGVVAADAPRLATVGFALRPVRRPQRRHARLEIDS